MKLKLTTTTHNGREVKAIQLPKSHDFLKQWKEQVEPTKGLLEKELAKAQDAKDKQDKKRFDEAVENCETLYRNGKLITRKLWSALEYDITKTFPNDYDERKQTLRLEGNLVLILNDGDEKADFQNRIETFAKENNLTADQKRKLIEAVENETRGDGRKHTIRRVSIKGDDYEGLSLGKVIQKLQDEHNIPDEIAVEIATEIIDKLKDEGEGDTNERKLRFDEKKGFYTFGD